MSKRKNNIVTVFAAIVVLLLVFGVIGALIYFTNGFTEEPTSFYVVIGNKKIMSIEKGYEINEPLNVEVHYVLDKVTEVKGYSVTVVPHVEEGKDFSYDVDGKSVKWSEEKDLLAGFDIKKSDQSFVITPKGDLQKILEKVHSGSEVGDCSGLTKADMFELRIVSYNEKSSVSILFTVPEGYQMVAQQVIVDKDSVAF